MGFNFNMGNLYTTIVRQPSARIELLYKLKIAYNTIPRNGKEIKKLKRKLWEIDIKERRRKANNLRKSKMSLFNGLYS